MAEDRQNSLLSTQDQRVLRMYIENLSDYLVRGARYGEACLSLRRMWEMLLSYVNFYQKGDRIPIWKTSADDVEKAQKMTKGDDMPLLARTEDGYPVWQAVNALCHYQPFDKQIEGYGVFKRSDALSPEERWTQLTGIVCESSPHLMRMLLTLAEDDPILLQEAAQLFDQYRQALVCHQVPPQLTDVPAPKRDEQQKLNTEYLSHMLADLGVEYSHALNMVFYLRFITEYLIGEKCREYNRDFRKTNYEDYVSRLEKAGERKIADNAKSIRTLISDYIHWQHIPEGSKVLYDQKIEHDIRFARDELCSILVNDAVKKVLNDSVSDWVQQCMQQISGKTDTWREEQLIKIYDLCEALNRKAKRNKIMFAAGIALFLCAVLGAGVFFLRDIALPGDPKPAIREGVLAYSSTDIAEIPQVSVRCTLASGDDHASMSNELSADALTIISAPLASPVYELTFDVSAQCLGEHSLRFSSNARFMRSMDAQPNDQGIIMLQTELFKVMEQSALHAVRERMTAQGARLNGTYHLSEPGWYELRVQAVGAADGYAVKDGMVRAATGWQTYRFLLLPEDSASGLAFAARNVTAASASVGAGGSLDAQTGNLLSVQLHPMVTDYAEGYYRWDNDATEHPLISGDYIEVPAQLDAGLHTLHLGVRYRHGSDSYAPQSSGYTAMLPVAVAMRQAQEKTVSVTVKNAKGWSIDDGEELVYTPGEEIFVYYTSKGYYARFSITEVDAHTGEVLADLTNDYYKNADNALVLSKAYTGDQRLVFEVYDENYAGNKAGRGYASISITPLARTHQDEMDDHGNPILTWRYGSGHLPTGYTRYDYQYDQGEMVSCSQTHWTMDHQPALAGYYHRKDTRYEQGRIISERYYDAQGDLVIEEEGQPTGVDYVYESDTQFRMTYIGRDGTPMIDDVTGAASIDQTLDARGNVTDTYLYNAQGQPMEGRWGYHARHVRYDEQDRPIEQWEEDIHGKMVGRRECFGYDAQGYEILYQVFYDDGSREEIHREPGMGVVYSETYDGSDTLTHRYEQVEQDGVFARIYHWDGSRATYQEVDDFGNMITFREELADGTVLTNYRQSFIENSKLPVRQVFMDGNGDRKNDPELGYAVVQHAYDEYSGSLLSTSYFDEDGRPVLCPDGYASVKYTYENSLETSRTYCGTNGEPIVCAAGENRWASRRILRDAHGNDLRISYFDALDQPVNALVNDSGAARHDKEWGWIKDAWRLVQERFYNADGSPMALKEKGCFGMQYVYADGGMYTYFLDQSGVPTVIRMGETEVDRRFTCVSDGGTTVLEERWLGDAPASGVYRLEWRYDLNDELEKELVRYTEWQGDRKTEYQLAKDPLTQASYYAAVSFYDQHGEPVTDASGVWQYRQQRSYDQQMEEGTARYLIEQSYLDVLAKPVHKPGSDYVRRTQSYLLAADASPDQLDAYGYELRYYGADGLPVEHVPTETETDHDAYQGARVVYAVKTREDGSRTCTVEGYDVRDELLYKLAVPSGEEE